MTKIKVSNTIEELIDELQIKYDLLSKEIEEKTKMASNLYYILIQLRKIKNDK